MHMYTYTCIYTYAHTRTHRYVYLYNSKISSLLNWRTTTTNEDCEWLEKYLFSQQNIFLMRGDRRQSSVVVLRIFIENWQWISEGCGNVIETPIRSWRQNQYFMPLCVRVCARVRRYVGVSLCVCVWVCVRVGWLRKTGRILWLKTSGSWSNLSRLVKCACLPNVQFQMNTCVPLISHDLQCVRSWDVVITCHNDAHTSIQCASV